ncbi:MAG: heavy metal-responsive transcriptional regulator [Pseudomonadota bacterium]|nr:heavy metal-responsive transcriptional regulator [Pseudomonadota bacterium]
MKIGQLALATDTPIDTIRYYESNGVLPRPDRQLSSGYRLYDEADIERLNFVRRAKTLGFTLREIRELLALSQGDDMARVRDAAREKLDDVERKLAELIAIRDGLKALVAACPGQGDLDDCPILDALSHPPTDKAARP